jgi:predicted DNA-binding transcriptional regulator YafY
MTRDEMEAAWPWSPRPCDRARQQERINGIENYLFIGGDKLSVTQAAARLGVTRRTVQRYRASLRAIGAGR